MLNSFVYTLRLDFVTSVGFRANLRAKLYGLTTHLCQRYILLGTGRGIHLYLDLLYLPKKWQELIVNVSESG